MACEWHISCVVLLFVAAAAAVSACQCNDLHHCLLLPLLLLLCAGTTTATVLARAILNEGCKSVAAGMNPMDLRRGINMAVDHVLQVGGGGHGCWGCLSSCSTFVG
jgi:hypothetical protein